MFSKPVCLFIDLGFFLRIRDWWLVFYRIVKQFIPPTFGVYLCGAMVLNSDYWNAGPEYEYRSDFYFHK